MASEMTTTSILYDNTTNSTAENHVEDGMSELPLTLRVGLLVVLLLALFYGVPFNLLLMTTIARVKELRTRLNTFLFCLSLVDVGNSSLVVLAFIYHLLNLTRRNITLQFVFCTAISTGILFTNMVNYMLFTSMAILRHKTMSGAHVSRHFVKGSVAAIFFSTTCLCIFYVESEQGVSIQICMNPYGPIRLGQNSLFLILALPFLICVTVTMYCYTNIIKITKNHQNTSSVTTHRPRTIIKPMVTMFIVFLTCYFPVLTHAMLRKVHGMSRNMAHAQLAVNAFNCLGHALISTAYYSQSLMLRKALLLTGSTCLSTPLRVRQSHRVAPQDIVRNGVCCLLRNTDQPAGSSGVQVLSCNPATNSAMPGINGTVTTHI